MIVGSTRRPMAEINVTPLVDVVLVLLIIFMVTAPFLQGGLEIDLPKVATRGIDVRSCAVSAYPVCSGCLCGVGCDLGVGAGGVLGAESEQGLEGGHRCLAAVVTEDVFVEVDGQVFA